MSATANTNTSQVSNTNVGDYYVPVVDTVAQIKQVEVKVEVSQIDADAEALYHSLEKDQRNEEDDDIFEDEDEEMLNAVNFKMIVGESACNVNIHHKSCGFESSYTLIVNICAGKVEVVNRDFYYDCEMPAEELKAAKVSICKKILLVISRMQYYKDIDGFSTPTNLLFTLGRMNGLKALCRAGRIEYPTCSVCQCDTRRKLSHCRHFVCVECLVQMFRVNPNSSCPLCRAEIVSAKDISVAN